MKNCTERFCACLLASVNASVKRIDCAVFVLECCKVIILVVVVNLRGVSCSVAHYITDCYGRLPFTHRLRADIAVRGVRTLQVFTAKNVNDFCVNINFPVRHEFLN